MTSKNFLNKENISMIWDVISDEDIFKFLSRDIQNKIASVFTNNLKGFFDNESTQTNNLININKKYIMLILNYITKNYPYQPNKIKILEEIKPQVSKELITYEEFQNDKKSQFEKELSKRQEDFTNSMALQVPDVPEFGDKFEEKPITEMEKIIKEMTAQRNYEVEQINKKFQPPDTWLKSQETSIKNEKNINQKAPNFEENTNNRLKYIKTENEVINLNSPEKKKNVTWSENLEAENNDFTQNNNIFNKLKKINNNQPQITFEELTLNNTNNTNDTNDTNNTNNTNDIKEDRIQKLENEIKLLNNKMDMLINILKPNK